ncbi:MAG: hypothetical protein QM755_21670 [Luteolibacter sp.]
MSEHVYARLSGHGLTVTPVASFIARVGEEEALDIALPSGRFARIEPDAEGYVSRVNQSTTRSLSEVADITSGGKFPAWRVETGIFCSRIPRGFSVVTVDLESSQCPFEFRKDPQHLLFFQLPPPGMSVGEMIQKSDEVLSSDEAGNEITVRYEVAEGVFRQRRKLRHLGGLTVCLTAQGPDEDFAPASDALDEIYSSIVVPDIGVHHAAGMLESPPWYRCIWRSIRRKLPGFFGSDRP